MLKFVHIYNYISYYLSGNTLYNIMEHNIFRILILNVPNVVIVDYT